MPSRVNPRFQTTGPAQAGDTRNWLEIYQTAAGKIMRLKNGLANIANDIKDYNYSPFRFTGSLAVINNNIYLSQKLIYDIKNEIRVLSLTNLKLKGDFENRCKYKMKDCAKYPCSIEEQACSGTPYWQEYGWYETTFPTGDPIPKDACLNTWKAVYGPDAAKNGYQSDLMQVDWDTQIENLSASAINLEQMIDGLPSCLGTPCLSPNDAAIIFWLNGAKNNVGSLTNTFISGLKKEICPAGAYNNCLDYCNGDNYKKTYSSCRTACSRFSPASGAVNACRDYCKDKCDGNSSCSVSRCKNACGNGNSACPKDPFAKYNLEANLKSFLDSLTAISDRFLAIQNAWNQQSPGSPPEPDGRPRAELDVAETYAWRVKKTIELSKEIIGFLSAAKSSWEQLRSAYYDLKGNSSIKNLTNAWGVLFEGEGKMDIIEKVEKTVGKGYACDAKAEGFLPKIKCFEETIGKKFGKANDNDPDGLYEFFVKISKIEDMLFNLDGPTVTIKDKVYTSMKNLVYGLEPMIDMDKKTNDSDYLSKLADNPISYLDESFTKIDSQIKQNGSWLGDIAKGLNSFFHDAYQEPIKLAGEHTATLNRLVFGEDDLRQACNGLNVVLEQNPEDFKTACLAVKTNLTSDSKLNGLCTNFSVFGASLGSKTELVNEISKLNKQWNSPPESDPKKKPCKDVDGSDSRWPGCQIVKIKKDNLESIKCLKCQCGENSCECSNSETNCKNLSDEEYANFGRQCSYLANQKETEKACGQFGILSAALQNKCSDINTPFSSFCADQACSDNEGCVKYCRDKIKVGDQEINGSGRCNNLKDGIGKICDKNYQAGCPDSGLPNLLGDDQAVLREKLKNVCSTKITDIKSNLDKVMRAFSIVIGIKSFTAIAQPDIKLSWKKGVEFNGFQGPKDLWADTKKTIEEAYNLKDSLLNIKKDLKSAYNSKMPDDALDAKGGFKFNPPTCEKEPANSYSAITKVTKTGPNGGPVCPDADEYFQLLDAHFSQIRQHLYQIDLERKNMKRLRLGPLSLDIIRTAPNVFPQVSEVYNTASDLKQKAQLLWALGNAVDFAQKNCTCGQSVCDICLYEKDNGAGEKVCWAPLCVSGVPLTPTPFTQPFCYVTYIMREPMKSMAESLENQLLGK
jgi:hypothetical protein